MATFTFSQVLVWDLGSGGAVRYARHARVGVIDPSTGLVPAGLTQGGAPVASLVSDAEGAVDFSTTDVPTVVLTSPSGVERRVTSQDAIEAAADYGVSEDAAVSVLVSNPASSTRSSLESWSAGKGWTTQAAGDARWQRDLGVVTPQMFGAVGDEVTDDTTAIQAAIDAAPAGGTVYFPPGSYKVTKATTDATTNWGICLTITKPLTLEGPGTLVSPALFADRSLILCVRSSDVTVRGLRFNNTATTASPYSIGVGMGDTYDTAAAGTALSNLTIDGCSFTNQWLSVSCQLKDSTTSTIDGVTVTGCTATAKAGVATAGNYNFRTEVPGSISSVTVGDCRAHNGITASAFNFYGVHGATISGCIAVGNGYAGCELENDCRHVAVSGFTAIDCEEGLWIDDSSFITVNGLSVRMPAGTSREALHLTYSAGTTENVIVSGVISHLGRISIGTFGGSPSGGFGFISISDVTLLLDGVNQSRGLLFSALTADLSLTNVNVFGAATDAIAGTINTPGTLRIVGGMSAKVGAEASKGLEIFGTGSLLLTSAGFHGTPTTPTYVIEGGGRRQVISGTGSPEGAVAAAIGTLYINRSGATGTTFYVKESGTSATSTGWVGK